ncbi:MAG: hypothetical protein JJU06_11395 [Ectothiorhodospiraceae bacterium]|nr:hypothetical protein [Ectothiorhodospiraceae bacterium]
MMLNVNELQVGERIPELIVDVSTKTIVMGAAASRDWQPLHHDPGWAISEAGLPGIIMNNYTQAGWISRFITDWCGPNGRIGRLRFKMQKPICPGRQMRVEGHVAAIDRDDDALCWVGLELTVHADDVLATTATATVALPVSEPGAAWRRGDGHWQPRDLCPRA